MMRMLCVLGVAGLLVSAPDAAARPKGGKGQGHNLEMLFKKLDTNHDHKLSREEFAKITELRKGKSEGNGQGKGKGKGVEKLFDKLDANNDGFVTLEEFKKISELRKKKEAK